MTVLGGVFFTCADCPTRDECDVRGECDREPSLAAVNAMAGFDDLPSEFRDLLNYHTASMVSGERPVASILPLIERHGARKTLDALRRTLDTVAANPDHWQDMRENNVTQRDIRSSRLQRKRQRS